MVSESVIVVTSLGQLSARHWICNAVTDKDILIQKMPRLRCMTKRIAEAGARYWMEAWKRLGTEKRTLTLTMGISWKIILIPVSRIRITSLSATVQRNHISVLLSDTQIMTVYSPLKVWAVWMPTWMQERNWTNGCLWTERFLFHVQKPITVHCMVITVLFPSWWESLTTSVWMTWNNILMKLMRMWTGQDLLPVSVILIMYCISVRIQMNAGVLSDIIAWKSISQIGCICLPNTLLTTTVPECKAPMRWVTVSWLITSVWASMSVVTLCTSVRKLWVWA